MRAYLFASQANEMISAFSQDRTGSNLPAAFAPWRTANASASVFVGNETDYVAQAIQKDGFYLLTPEPPAAF